MTANLPVLEAGDLVEDREDETGDPAVVVNLPPVTADEWEVIPLDCTLAEDNPEYPDDSDVVVVVFEEDLDEVHPHWMGKARQLALKDLNEEGIQYYSFPRPRLRRIGERGLQEIAVDRLQPMPYHSREFQAEDNSQHIHRLRENGQKVIEAPTVWVSDSGLRVLDGHKRVWMASAADVDVVDCLTLYLTEEEAVETWCWNHLEDYSDEEYEEAVRRLRRDGWWPPVDLRRS